MTSQSAEKADIAPTCHNRHPRRRECYETRQKRNCDRVRGELSVRRGSKGAEDDGARIESKITRVRACVRACVRAGDGTGGTAAEE